MTDGRALGGPPHKTTPLLLEKIEAAANAGVPWIQIREKQLSGRELAEFVEQALRRVPASCRVLVNDRLDVACAVGAGGVHLGERSLPTAAAKRLVIESALPKDFLIGVSTHSLPGAQDAEKAGADYILFGPVFATPSKAEYGSPQGVEKLAEVCRNVSLPVLAIGGVTLENARSCLAAGARGIAAIRLFQDAPDMACLLRALKTGPGATGG